MSLGGVGLSEGSWGDLKEVRRRDVFVVWVRSPLSPPVLWGSGTAGAYARESCSLTSTSFVEQVLDWRR